MRYLFLLIALFLFFVVVPSASYAIGMELGLGIWRQEPEGRLSYRPLVLTDTVDLNKDLKYDTETRAMGRVKIDMPLLIPNIYIMATPMSFSGRGQKDINFKFGDKTFSASVPFDSEVAMDHLDIALFYGIPGLKKLTLEKLNIELGLNARVIDFSAKINQPTTGYSESKSFTIPVPMFYAGIQVKPLKRLAIEAEGRGISYSGNHYYSIIGRLKIKAVGPLFVAGGYRYDDISIEEKDINADVKFKGPFAEAGLMF